MCKTVVTKSAELHSPRQWPSLVIPQETCIGLQFVPPIVKTCHRYTSHYYLVAGSHCLCFSIAEVPVSFRSGWRVTLKVLCTVDFGNSCLSLTQ